MPVEKPPFPGLKDRFVQQIQGMILSGELMVGSRLPPERTLAEQLHVSRTVVNSGLAELAGQGFLEVRPRRGTCVADYRRQGNLSTLAAMVEYSGGELGRDDVRSLLEARRALEQLAASRAIRYAGDDELERLGVRLVRIAASPGPSEAAEAAFSFHHELALIGGNSIVPLIYSSLKPPLVSFWAQFCSRNGVLALVRDTETLCSFIRQRDLDGASRWIDAYLEKAISGSQQICEMF